MTVLGIALGVAVMVAIRLANDASLRSFRTATESLAGKASTQIRASSGRFDELLLKDLDWLREYGLTSPVIEGYAMFLGNDADAERSSPPTTSETLRVLAVDILRDREFRDYQLLKLHGDDEQPTGRDFLDLLRDPEAVILTQRFANRNGIDVGERVEFVFDDRQVSLTVRGLLLDSGPARALDGNFALLDIAVGQLLFNRVGFLDRLDVKLADTERDSTDAIRQRLPASLRARDPGQRYRQIETMIAAFHFNLNALGFLALMVGLFLVYNSVTVTVIRRRREIGILSSLGTPRAVVQGIFLLETLGLSVLGTLLGLPLGELLAEGAVEATATTVETFYIAQAATSVQQGLTLGDVLLAFAVTPPLAMLAAWLPAREAGRVSPIEVTRDVRSAESLSTPPRRSALGAILLTCMSYPLSQLPAWNGLPVWGYAASITLLFAGALLVPTALWLLCRLGKVLARRLRVHAAVDVELACANLQGAIPRVSVSTASLAVSLAMMIAISIMIGSFRETVTYWIGQTLRADLFVKPITLTTATSEAFLSPSSVDLIRAHSDVIAVDRFVSHSVDYGAWPINLGAGEFDVVLGHGNLAFKSPANVDEARRRMRAAIGADSVVISESFSLRFNKQPGDSICLPTPEGERDFSVAAVYYDYSNNRGTVVMDRSTYVKRFQLSFPEEAKSLAVYLRPEADADEVSQALQGMFPDDQKVFISTQRRIRSEVMRIFDSTFVITYALEVVAIVIAAMGVVATLLTLLLDRRREVSLLGVVGASSLQTRRVVLLEAIVLGSVSLLVGCLVGTLLSAVLIFVINVQSFGWTIQYQFPWVFVLQSAVSILVATGLAALYPATRAARWNPARILREE